MFKTSKSTNSAIMKPIMKIASPSVVVHLILFFNFQGCYVCIVIGYCEGGDLYVFLGG
jgi:hypothetical protein